MTVERLFRPAGVAVTAAERAARSRRHQASQGSLLGDDDLADIDAAFTRATCRWCDAVGDHDCWVDDPTLEL